MKANLLPPIGAITPQAVPPVPHAPMHEMASGNNNHITLNAINMADIRGVGVHNIAMINDISLNVTGDNNDITINAINILSIDSQPDTGEDNISITATQNPDGSIVFSDGGNVQTFVDSKIIEAINAYMAEEAEQDNAPTPAIDMVA